MANERALIEIDPSVSIPGERGLVALANLFATLAHNQTPEQVQKLTDRFLELTEPYHKINVAISQNIAQFIAKLLRIKVEEVKLTATPVVVK